MSLAAGTCPEAGPTELISACASVGWPACGVWFDARTWTAATTREVRRRFDDAGMVALDLEPIFVTPDGDHGDQAVDVAAEVGARNVLVVGRGVEGSALSDRLAQLCDRAADAGVGCSLEFLPIMSVRDLASAVAVVEATGRENASVLIDNLHLSRSGGTPDQVADLDPGLLAYAQICDAPAEPDGDLTVDALDGRSVPGAGQLPVEDVIRALPPGLPLSLEIRSAELRERLPDVARRAEAVLSATADLLERLGEHAASPGSFDR